MSIEEKERDGKIGIEDLHSTYQMLAGIALIVSTVILFKMKRERYAWVTLIPTAWLLICTLTAGLQKLLSTDVKIGFLSHAFKYQDAVAQGKVLAPAKSMDQMQQIILNDYVDAALAGAFVAVVVSIAIFGVIYAVRALGNPSVSTAEVGGMAAAE